MSEVFIPATDDSDDGAAPGEVSSDSSASSQQEEIDVAVEGFYGNSSFHQKSERRMKRREARTGTHRGSHGSGSSRTFFNRRSTPFDVSYRPGRLRLYSRPMQRQHWGDHQVLPRVNWGDLFFDLFYVAATYNVSYILVDSPSQRGLLYAAGTFWPVMGFWMDKTHYDARFVTEDDLLHLLYTVAGLVVLATAVLDIRVVEQMSHPEENSSMFVFALSLLMFQVLHFFRTAELYFMGVGQVTSIKHAAVRDMRRHGLSFACNIAACVIAGIEYYGNSDQQHRRLAAAETAYATESESEPNDIPIYLILAGYVANELLYSLEAILCAPITGRHDKEIRVPSNVDFVLHRNGEWIMLMLGESIFSLLIIDVPDETPDFFGTFYCGVLTVTFLQYLHFRSQPHSADGHAIRRHRNAGLGWVMLQYVYSLALVSLGSAFTFFLTHFDAQDEYADSYSSAGYDSDKEYDDAGNSSYPSMASNYTADEGKTGGDDDAHRRWLAAASTSDYDAESLRQRSATLFAASLAIIFFCLDAMTLLHVGLVEGRGRCVCPDKKTKNWKGILICIVRVALIVFVSTLSLWETDPLRLAFIGVICVLAQLLLRKLGLKYLHKHWNAQDRARHEDATWPNVTTARAERTHELSEEEELRN